MDDQRLRHDGLHEPAGVKHLGGVGVIQRLALELFHHARHLGLRLGHEVRALEHKPHHRKGGVIEDGTDRSQQHHELGDFAHLPRPRLGNLVGADIVRGNRHLREIIQQIVRQNLQGQDRLELEEVRRAQHAEHVAEVGTGPHADIFEDVYEHLAAFDNPFLQHHQIFFQEDDVGGFLGDVHRVVHGNAHVRRAQCRGVVDAISHETNHVTLLLQRLHHALLVRGGQPGVDIHAVDHVGELFVGHLFHVIAEDDLFGVDPDLGADLAGDQIVVAGEHLDGHAMLPQSGDGLGGGVLGRIEKREVAGQHELIFVGLGIGGLGHDLLVRNGQYAETIFAQRIDLFDQIANENRLHLKDFPVAFKMRAAFKDRLRRAFGEQLALPIRSLDHHGHHAAGEVERDFVHFGELVHGEFLVQLRVFQHRAVEHIFEARLEMADQIGIAQHFIALVLEDIAMDFQNDVVNRERAGFVRAEHVHGAKVLNGV